MDIRILTKEQRAEVFHQFLTKDFHKSEVKPLDLMERLIDQEKYLCCGIYKDQGSSNLLGYAYFAILDYQPKPILLIDFFAVVSSVRSRGFGSKFLKELRSSLKDRYTSVLAEVENPSYAPDEDNKTLRKRRIDFYHRNGFKTSKILSRVQTDEYQILVLNFDEPLSDSQVYDSMCQIYQSLNGIEFFNNHIQVRHKTQEPKKMKPIQ